MSSATPAFTLSPTDPIPKPRQGAKPKRGHLSGRQWRREEAQGGRRGDRRGRYESPPPLPSPSPSPSLSPGMVTVHGAGEKRAKVEAAEAELSGKPIKWKKLISKELQSCGGKMNLKELRKAVVAEARAHPSHTGRKSSVRCLGSSSPSLSASASALALLSPLRFDLLSTSPRAGT